MIFSVLRQNLRPAQLFGFMIANLLGGFILLVGLQTYTDIDRFLSVDEGWMRGEQIVITKPVSSISTIGAMLGWQPEFSDNEIQSLKAQPGIREVGAFTAAQCHVRGAVALGKLSLQTDMFLESVPDNFVDVKMSGNDYFQRWSASVNDSRIPIILPRSYLNLYNYGYASTNGLPQLSEGLTSRFPLRLFLDGAGRQRSYEAHIVGFSNHINTILAPADFIREVNQIFAANKKTQPSRLLLATDASHGQEELLKYLDEQGYVIEGNSDTLKMQSFVHGLLYLLAAIGLVIMGLAFYLLILSISLLMERNRDRLATLYALGYSMADIARPYRMLILSMDLVVWLLTALLAGWGYSYIASFLQTLSPGFDSGAIGALLVATLVLILLSAVAHDYLIRHKIQQTINTKN